MIAGTLAFVLAKDKGRFLRIKPIEIEPPRESLRFLRKNNRKRLPMACGAARPIIFYPNVYVCRSKQSWSPHARFKVTHTPRRKSGRSPVVSLRAFAVGDAHNLGAARRFFGAGPQKHGRPEARIARVACGTPVLPRGAGPRGAGPAPAEGRRRFPPRKPGSGVYFGGAFAWFVLPWLPGAPPPTPPDRHCPGFLRSGAPEPACRTQTG